MSNAPDLAAARQLAIFDSVELPVGVTLRAGPSRDATSSANDLLSTLVAVETPWQLVDDKPMTTELGWELVVSEHAATARSGPLRAFVIKCLVGRKAAFLVAVLPDDAALAVRRDAMLAFAPSVIPAWSGSATLEDLLWLPDDGAIPPQWK